MCHILDEQHVQLEKAMNDSITFLIVRHPFERLLSAYRDKIMFALPHSLHDKMGMKIVRKYRKHVSIYTIHIYRWR